MAYPATHRTGYHLSRAGRILTTKSPAKRGNLNAIGNPKPVQKPHPPIMIGGRATSTLRVVAEHADIWNIPGGGDIDDLLGRGRLLDRFCTEIGRDPASITRSTILPVSYEQPGSTKDAISRTIEAGFSHIILGLTPPYPPEVAQWVTDQLIIPSS
jgi:alkanesulfonate monooxygenase SsuD/methylene tetrahydromethanopterin reductase-like flavin-dependent oxidoreductase (luciferase family)